MQTEQQYPKKLPTLCPGCKTESLFCTELRDARGLGTYFCDVAIADPLYYGMMQCENCHWKGWECYAPQSMLASLPTPVRNTKKGGGYNMSLEKRMAEAATVNVHEEKTKEQARIKTETQKHHPLNSVKFSRKAKHVTVSDTYLTVELVDGRVIAQPVAWTPGLVGATQAQRANYTLLGGGVAIAWEELDEDVHVGLMLNPHIGKGVQACCAVEDEENE